MTGTSPCPPFRALFLAASTKPLETPTARPGAAQCASHASCRKGPTDTAPGPGNFGACEHIRFQTVFLTPRSKHPDSRDLAEGWNDHVTGLQDMRGVMFATIRSFLMP